MQYMIVERFHDPVQVYERLRVKGRQAPAGLTYIDSWVDEDLEWCFQLMETADPKLLDVWMENWSDLVEFEIHPVTSSAEAAARALKR